MMIFDLSNATFIFPLFIDTDDRISNLKICLKYFNTYFKTNIIIAEQKSSIKTSFIIDKSEYSNLNITLATHISSNPLFHNTRLKNQAILLAQSQIICIYDIDVMFEPVQIFTAINSLKTPEFDVVYPYYSPTYDIPKGDIRDKFLDKYDFSVLKNAIKTPRKPHINVGGAIFTTLNWINEIGGFNEEIISWGSEDDEFYDRSLKLGGKIGRIRGLLWHLEHERGVNSLATQPLRTNNMEVHIKVKSMYDHELNKYVETILKPQLNQYQSDYFEVIE